MLEISDRNSDDLKKQEECRGKIRVSAEHLLSLINDVLDTSKLESCMTILRPQAEEQGILLKEKRVNLQHTRLMFGHESPPRRGLCDQLRDCAVYAGRCRCHRYSCGEWGNGSQCVCSIGLCGS